MYSAGDMKRRSVMEKNDVMIADVAVLQHGIVTDLTIHCSVQICMSTLIDTFVDQPSSQRSETH